MRRATIILPLAFAVIAPVLGGCGQDAPIDLTYERPARVLIPEKIKKVAVAEFRGASEQDQRWGAIAADKLSYELDKWNQQYHRYELVDRNNLAKVLKEQDIRIMTSERAVEAGKIAQVQALIFGNVRVNARDERASRGYFDVFSQTMKTKFYTKRFCLVSVNLTMTDVDTTKTVHAFTITKQFDSDKDGGSSAARAFGFGSDNPPPVDDTVNKLVDQVVQDFAQQISPHRVTIQEKLEKGKTDTVATGNKLAKAKDYAGALDVYKTAMQERADDDGAVFNAALMNEALGNLGEAENLYSKAFGMGKKEKCILARQRVRQEVHNSPDGK